MTLRQRDTQHHTYGDYVTWSADYGNELINGTAYIREPPAPSRAHQEIVIELTRQVANALEGKPCRAYAAPFDVRLPKANEADDQIDTVVQPDVLIVCDCTKLDERGMVALLTGSQKSSHLRPPVTTNPSNCPPMNTPAYPKSGLYIPLTAPSQSTASRPGATHAQLSSS
jgi:hypothetical protein